MQKSNGACAKLINEFTESYMGKLFYFCLKKTGNNVEAEDLTQDIALQIITALNKGTIPTSFSAWVWQIAHNRYSVWAKQKRRLNESVTGSDIGDYELEDKSANLLDEVLHTEQTALLRRELAFIKSDYRNIVVAYYIENKSVREIALLHSLPENTVKSKLFRAREILKEGMEMAREFGKRSYNPETIIYTNLCTRLGVFGQPWTLMSPKLNQNIFLACYDNPMTAEELAIEVGVALPYIEDVLAHLLAQTLLVKHGNRYETNFPIISREVQRKIHLYYEAIIPELVECLTEDIDRLMSQYNEAGLCYYGQYQSYDDAKWTLLMDFYKGLYSLCKNSPKTKLGNTQRLDEGVWDVVAFEKCDFCPDVVGFHCQYDGFVHYRFGYGGIQNRTPSNLSKYEAHELRLMVENKTSKNLPILEKLVEYGYAYKRNNKYIPNVVVISESNNKAFLRFCEKKKYSAEFIQHANTRKALHEGILDKIGEMNIKIRDFLCSDLPECIRKDENTVDALLESICTTSYTLGYLVKHALACGWLKCDENTSSAVGAYFYLD